MNTDENTTFWADGVVAAARAAGPLPAYGSAEWHAIPAGDPRRFAALVVAAEAHRRAYLPETIAARLSDELAVAAQLHAARFADVAADVRAHSGSPSWSDVRERWAS